MGIVFFTLQLLADYASQYKELNSEAFFQKWPKYQQKLRELCNAKFKCEKHTPWPDEMENILLLVKLFNAKKVTDNLQSFHTAVDKMMVFRVLCTSTSCTLYIIALDFHLLLTCTFLALNRLEPIQTA